MSFGDVRGVYTWCLYFSVWFCIQSGNCACVHWCVCVCVCMLGVIRLFIGVSHTCPGGYSSVLDHLSSLSLPLAFLLFFLRFTYMYGNGCVHVHCPGNGITMQYNHTKRLLTDYWLSKSTTSVNRWPCFPDQAVNHLTKGNWLIHFNLVLTLAINYSCCVDTLAD